MANRSIRRQLTERLLLGMIAFSAVFIGGLYVYLRIELFEEYNAALVTEARAIAGVLCSEETDEQSAELIRRSFPRMHLGPEEHGFLQVCDSLGRVVIRSNSLNGGDIPPVTLSGLVENPIVEDVILPDGGDGRATSLSYERLASVSSGDNPLQPSTRSTGPAYVMTLAVRRDELDETLSHLAFSLVFIGLGLTGAAVALVVYGVRRQLRPLDDFSDQVSRVDANSLSYRFSKAEVAEELLPISQRLNDLLARLDDSFNRERRFSANVAHELRTPIAELRSMIEVAIKWPSDPEGVARLHAGILEISVRMSRLVDAMFSLARMERAATPLITESHPLAGIVEAAWASNVSLARERNLAEAILVADDIDVCGDRTMLEGLIGNVFANAVQYAAAGTTISVRACPTHGVDDDDGDGVGTRLTVSNVTTELKAADLSQIDEPFWRKDVARTHGERLGLGLALVRDYARAMRVEVNFSMPEASKFVVELRWPATARPLAGVGRDA